MGKYQRGDAEAAKDWAWTTSWPTATWLSSSGQWLIFWSWRKWHLIGFEPNLTWTGRLYWPTTSQRLGRLAIDLFDNSLTTRVGWIETDGWNGWATSILVVRVRFWPCVIPVSLSGHGISTSFSQSVHLSSWYLMTDNLFFYYLCECYFIFFCYFSLFRPTHSVMFFMDRIDWELVWWLWPERDGLSSIVRKSDPTTAERDDGLFPMAFSWSTRVLNIPTHITDARKGHGPKEKRDFGSVSFHVSILSRVSTFSCLDHSKEPIVALCFEILIKLKM